MDNKAMVVVVDAEVDVMEEDQLMGDMVVVDVVDVKVEGEGGRLVERLRSFRYVPSARL